MEPYPKHCLICGRDVSTGIDSHIRNTHKMDYDTHCKWFYDAKGSYAIFNTGNKVMLTITRELRPD